MYTKNKDVRHVVPTEAAKQPPLQKNDTGEIRLVFIGRDDSTETFNPLRLVIKPDSVQEQAEVAIH